MINVDKSKSLNVPSLTLNNRQWKHSPTEEVPIQSERRQLNQDVVNNQADMYHSLMSESKSQRKESIRRNVLTIRQEQSQILSPVISPQPNEVKGDSKSNPLLKKTQVNPVFLIVTLKRAVNRFLNLSSTYQFLRLKKEQFSLINDISAYYQYFQLQNHLLNRLSFLERLRFQMKQSIYKTMKFFQLKMRSCKPILYPDSQTKIYIDFFLLMSYTIFVITVPIYLAFLSNYQFSQNFTLFHQFYPIIVFLADMILNFFTAYYDKGILILDSKQIIIKYVKSAFFYDFTYFLLYIIFDLLYNFEYFAIVLIIKSLSISSIIRKVQDNVEMKESAKALASLLQLVLQILMIAHFCGCAFFYLHRIEIQNGVEKTWTYRLDIPEDPVNWIHQYINSLYWAVITMVTIGYGDISPVTTIEKGFVILIAMIGSGVFAYSLNGIGAIFQQIDQKHRESSQQINTLISYLRKRNLSHQLVMQVRRYFQYLNEENIEENDSCQDMLDQLGSELRLQVKQDIYYKLLRSQKLLALNFSQFFLLELSSFIKEHKYGPEQYIYREGDVPEMLYIIMHGNIELKTEISRVQVLSIGDICGKQSFITSREESTSAITLNVVSVGTIDKDEFLSIIKKYPLDYEKFNQLRDNLNINSISRGLDLECRSCGDFTHQVNQCPYITYVPNQEQFLYDRNIQYNSQQLNRTPYNRREQRNIRPTAYLDVAHEAAAQILIDLNVFSNLDDLLERINQIQEVRKEDRKFQEIDYESDDSVHSETRKNINVPDASSMQSDIFGDKSHSDRNVVVQRIPSMTRVKFVEDYKQQGSNKNFTEFSFEESDGQHENKSNKTNQSHQTNHTCESKQKKPRSSNYIGSIVLDKSCEKIHVPPSPNTYKSNKIQQGNKKETIPTINGILQNLNPNNKITSVQFKNRNTTVNNLPMAEFYDDKELIKEPPRLNVIFEIQQSYDIDKSCQFQVYMPGHNIDQVLAKLDKMWFKLNGENMKKSQRPMNIEKDLEKRNMIIGKMQKIMENRQKSAMSVSHHYVSQTEQKIANPYDQLQPANNEVFSVYSKGGVQSNQSIKSSRSKMEPLSAGLGSNDRQKGKYNIDQLNLNHDESQNIHVEINNDKISFEDKANVHSSDDQFQDEIQQIKD